MTRRVESFFIEAEFRDDRAYDEQTSSHVVHPNGTVMDTYDRDLCAVLLRETLRLRGAA